MNQRISCDESLKLNNGIVFSWFDDNAICFLPEDSKEVQFLGFFDKAFSNRRMYKTIQACGDKIIFAPSLANDIAIYDINSRKTELIALKELDSSKPKYFKFWTSLCYGDFVFFIGHYYPAIIALNIYTNELHYISEWVEELETNHKNIENEPYLTEGVIIDDYAYLPFCCSNALLKFNLSNFSWEIIELDVECGGFNGLNKCDDTLYLITRNTNELVRWNYINNSIKKIKVCSDIYTDNYVGFHKPLIFNDYIYLLPIKAKHFYKIDLNLMSTSTIAELEYILDIPKQDFSTCYDVVINPYINNDKLCFITGSDYLWHEFNLSNNNERFKEIIISEQMQKTILDNKTGNKIFRQFRNGGICENETATLSEYIIYINSK